MGTIIPAPMMRISGHGYMTVSSAVKTLQMSTQAQATHILIQAVDADIRWTMDGTAPVGGSIGFLLQAALDGPRLVDIGSNVSQLKFIRNAASDAELQYQFMRQE